jgi:hypothetical protein
MYPVGANNVVAVVGSSHLPFFYSYYGVYVAAGALRRAPASARAHILRRPCRVANLLAATTAAAEAAAATWALIPPDFIAVVVLAATTAAAAAAAITHD